MGKAHRTPEWEEKRMAAMRAAVHQTTRRQLTEDGRERRNLYWQLQGMQRIGAGPKGYMTVVNVTAQPHGR